MITIYRPIVSYMLVITALFVLVTGCDTEHITSNKTMENTDISTSGAELSQSYSDSESSESELYNETYYDDTHDNFYPPATNEWNASNETYGNSDEYATHYINLKPTCIPVEQCAGKCGEKTVDYFNQCQCDDLCWFYGDCCFDYYAGCLNVTIFDDDETILQSLLVHVDSYSPLLILKEAYRWRRLSSCVQLQNRTFHAVSTCGTDPDLQTRFDKLHEKLNERSLNHASPFQEMSQADIIDRCQKQNWSQSQSGYRLDRIPASFNTSYSTVYFYNVFCAICNGIDPANVALVEYDVDCLSTQHLNDNWRHVQEALRDGCEELAQLPNDTRKCLDIRQAYQSSVFDLSLHTMTFEPALIPELHSNYEETPTKITVNEVKKEQWFPLNEMLEKTIATESNITESDGEALRCNSLVPINSRLCHMYAYPQVLPEKDLVFKNPHCQLCLASMTAQDTFGEILDSCMCANKRYLSQRCCNIMYIEITFPPHIGDFHIFVVSFVTESLDNLYNHFIEYRNKIENEPFNTVEIKQCPANQIYVPFYQKCYTITCTRGTHLVGKKCISPVRCLDSSPCHKNYTGSLETVDVLIPNTSNTVTIQLRLWYTLDDSDAKFDNANLKESREAQSNEEMWHQDKNGSYNLSVSLISHIQNLVNHTVEIFDSGICSQNYSQSSSVGVYCIFLTLNCNGDLTVDNLMSLLNTSLAVSSLVKAAHDNNFILRDITLSNALSDSQLKSIQKSNQSDPNELQSYCRDGTVLHSEVKSVVYNETGRSYNVEISDSLYALGSFLYSVKIDIDARTQARRFSLANVSWCKEDIFIFDCNYTTVAFNTSYFIRYSTSIVMTNHKEQMDEFREHVWGREENGVNVREFVNLFQQLHGINDTVIYESNEFRVENDQVFVCSDFNSSFEVVHESNVSKRYSHMSKDKLEQLTTLVALCVSITCLVVVLSVYSLVPELRNVPGRIVMSMSSALLLAQVLFLCCSHPRGLACEVYASVHHAAWLASSAWLTAMSVHLTFTLYSNSHASLLSSANSFTIISILCWGVPLLLGGCCFTLDKTGIVAMDYGKNEICWIGNVHAVLFAFGLPMFTFLAVTSVCAVCVIGAITNSCLFRKRNTSTHKGVRKHLLLCINLGLLMGFNWVFYFVAVAVDAPWMWVVFIFTNGSQGLYIFLCYVARKSVLTKLRKKLNLCKSSSENRGRNVGSHVGKSIFLVTQ